MMALSIKNPRVEKLAREIARLYQKPITEAVQTGLEHELARQKAMVKGSLRTGRVERLLEIGRHCASLPDINNLTDDEILGYDEFGAPTR